MSMSIFLGNNHELIFIAAPRPGGGTAVVLAASVAADAVVAAEEALADPECGLEGGGASDPRTQYTHSQSRRAPHQDTGTAPARRKRSTTVRNEGSF